MAYFLSAQTMLGSGGSFGSASFGPGGVVFNTGPDVFAGADYWEAYYDYAPGSNVPSFTSAGSTGLIINFSAPLTDQFYNYASLDFVLPTTFNLGNYNVVYYHDFTGLHPGRFADGNASMSSLGGGAFLAASDWGVTCSSPGGVVQSGAGTIIVPVRVSLTSPGARVGGPENNAWMRFSAGSPNTGPVFPDAPPASGYRVPFNNPPTGSAPSACAFYDISLIFGGDIVTGPTPMTVTLDNLVPPSPGGGTWSSILLYNQTHSFVVIVYPSGTVLSSGGGTGSGGGGGVGTGGGGTGGTGGGIVLTGGVSASYGCTNPLAVNYNPFASIDNGSCILPIFGCTVPGAVNYRPSANKDDGSCVFPLEPAAASPLFPPPLDLCVWAGDLLPACAWTWSDTFAAPPQAPAQILNSTYYGIGNVALLLGNEPL